MAQQVLQLSNDTAGVEAIDRLAFGGGTQGASSV